jgi:hypothetical protein
MPIPSWRNCSWIIVAVRSRMWPPCVMIENRTALPPASSSMPSPFRSPNPILARSDRAFAGSCGKVGAAGEYHVALPDVMGPCAGSAAPRNTVLTIASR